MADAAMHTEAWSALGRGVGQLPKLRSRARRYVPQRVVSMSRTSGLTSRMRPKSHVRFCNGRGWGNPPPDRNPMIVTARRLYNYWKITNCFSFCRAPHDPRVTPIVSVFFL